MKEIRVKLKDAAGGWELEEVFPKDDIGVTRDDIIRLDSDVSIKARVSLVDKILLVEADFAVECSSECGRCLEEVRQPFRSHATLDFDVKDIKDSIDIAEDLRQEFVMNLPMKLLCKDDCKGLCLECGTNLNLKDCGHHSVVNIE